MITPVILCGGVGSRLWPLSRENFPKQFLNLIDDHSLLQNTLSHLTEIKHVEKILIICSVQHKFIVQDHISAFPQFNFHLITEPCGRNTAPAIALAAWYELAQMDDPALLVLPADHTIANPKQFAKTIDQASQLVAENQIITFGIQPQYAATGYGYIKRGVAIRNHTAAKIDAFVEKPSQKTAEQYLNSDEYLWNSGIFFTKCSAFLDALQQHRPDIFEATRSSFTHAKQGDTITEIPEDYFKLTPAESIDYAIMEKTDQGIVVPLDVAWSDIGSWQALADLAEKDHDGNIKQGDVQAHNTEDCFLKSTSRLVTAAGVKDIMLIETPDAVLVTQKSTCQDVKPLLGLLQANKRDEATTHTKVYRPWGFYETLIENPGFKVKRLMIHPGGQLSLQSHNKRSEHWTVVKGCAEITRGDETFNLKTNQSCYIPIGTKHRMTNNSANPVEIVEVQVGEYLGEDDIIRFDDIYGRIENEITT